MSMVKSVGALLGIFFCYGSMSVAMCNATSGLVSRYKTPFARFLTSGPSGGEGGWPRPGRPGVGSAGVTGPPRRFTIRPNPCRGEPFSFMPLNKLEKSFANHPVPMPPSPVNDTSIHPFPMPPPPFKSTSTVTVTVPRSSSSHSVIVGWEPPVEWVKVTGGHVKVRRMAGNGDCLFASVRDQLAIVRHKNPNELPSIPQLRHQVSAYLKSVMNDEMVAASILQTASEDPSLCAHVPRSEGAASEQNGQARESESQNNNIVEMFIQRLATTQCWGGAESIFALSQLFGVSIRVFNELERDFKFGELEEELKICYRGSSGARHHYDSVIEVKLAPDDREREPGNKRRHREGVGGMGMQRERVGEGEMQRESERGEEMRIERERDTEIQRERERAVEMQRERERDMQIQRERERDMARVIEREREMEMQREREMQRRRERDMEMQREREMQRRRERDMDMQRERDTQRKREWDMEMQRRRERDMEMQRRRERDIEMQRRRERAMEMQRERDMQRERERDMAIQREKERYKEMHRERVRQRERERARNIQKQRYRAIATIAPRRARTEARTIPITG